jgi:predicted Rossmann fold nucleotide-binding protein DprA/Smf involved in DNA uptake
MQFSQQTQVTMLLTISFGKSAPTNAKPLSKNEWARFAVWLRDHGLDPASLLVGNIRELLSDWVDRTVTVDRLEVLLGRGATLGIALERWERIGLWVLTRSDPDYPERLKRLLRTGSPPVLFGCGNRKLLNRGGIAVVGSRNATDEDLKFTNGLGRSAAFDGHSIVSGGARGVDQAAMSGALENEGTAVGILADSLFKSASSAKYRKSLVSGDLVLLSPFNPEAGFSVGNAMGRNRYIYCLSDLAVVVSSTLGKGGTWSGALENLNAGWVPLQVKHTSITGSGNSVLVQKGGEWLSNDLASIDVLSKGSRPAAGAENLPPIIPATDEGNSEPFPNKRKPFSHYPGNQPTESPVQKHGHTQIISDIGSKQKSIDLYGLFLEMFDELTASAPMKLGEIAENLELEKGQVGTWLKRGVEDGKVEKLLKPVRYQLLRSQALL